MYQGTTPTLQFTVEGYDLTSSRVFLSMTNWKSRALRTWNTLDNPEMTVGLDPENQENSLIRLVLSQEDTLSMPTGQARVQVRWIDSSGHSMATDVASVNVKEVLYREVISFSGGDGE